MSSLSLVILLCALACPLTMGVMMWLMGKGMRQRQATGAPDEEPDEH